MKRFFYLNGHFRIRWGDQGENKTYLEPLDMIAVPPGVVRDFTNVSDKTARLLVGITGEAEDDFNRIEMPPVEVEQLKKKFGDDILDKFAAIGVSFNAGLDD